MHIVHHEFTIERLGFDTLFKFIAGFAKSMAYGSFSRKIPRWLCWNIVIKYFILVFWCLELAQRHAATCFACSRVRNVPSGNTLGGIMLHFRAILGGCHWRQDHAATCSRYDCGHFETRMEHAIINFVVSLANSGTFYCIRKSGFQEVRKLLSMGVWKSGS